MKKNKRLKINSQGIKYLKYARYTSFLLIIAFMGLVGSLMYTSKSTYFELIQKNPILLAGFIDCFGNLILFFLLKRDIEKIEYNEQDYLLPIKFILDMAVFACLLNLPALITMILGTMKSFYWDKKTFDQLKITGKSNWKFITGYSLCFLSLILCFYWVLASFTN